MLHARYHRAEGLVQRRPYLPQSHASSGPSGPSSTPKQKQVPFSRVHSLHDSLNKSSICSDHVRVGCALVVTWRSDYLSSNTRFHGICSKPHARSGLEKGLISVPRTVQYRRQSNTTLGDAGFSFLNTPEPLIGTLDDSNSSLKRIAAGYQGQVIACIERPSGIGRV